jgi:hypothetical protein
MLAAYISAHSDHEKTKVAHFSPQQLQNHAHFCTNKINMLLAIVMMQNLS